MHPTLANLDFGYVFFVFTTYWQSSSNLLTKSKRIGFYFHFVCNNCGLHLSNLKRKPWTLFY